MASSTVDIERLAAQIGEQIYLDIAKWHLYLSDARLHTPLAEQVFPMLEENTLSSAAVTQILQGMSVALGGGRKQVSVLDLLPTSGESQLMELLEEFQRDL
ncbi:MAG: DUF3181 family protein [Cyanobacteria bacterium P01_H01_bin.15]